MRQIPIALPTTSRELPDAEELRTRPRHREAGFALARIWGCTVQMLLYTH
jgi:hypothetical protein